MKTKFKNKIQFADLIPVSEGMSWWPIYQQTINEASKLACSAKSGSGHWFWWGGCLLYTKTQHSSYNTKDAFENEN